MTEALAGRVMGCICAQASRDFIHWTQLPVAIWNDKWYDSVAIFSGSTTIVDGKPVIVCKTQHPQTATASSFPTATCGESCG